MRKNREGGFTLVEFLVSVALLTVLVGLIARPMRDVVGGLIRTRQEGAAFTRNLLFLEQLGRDARPARAVTREGNDTLRISRGEDEASVVWRIEGTSATREEGSRKTNFPVEILSLDLIPDDGSGRYLLLRGEFRGIGFVEKGLAPRLEI